MPDFQLVSAAVLVPGTCATCGRSGDGPMIDTLAEFPPPGGRIYLCPLCVDEANRLRGGLDPMQAQELRERLAAAAERETQLQAELEGKLAEIFQPEALANLIT